MSDTHNDKVQAAIAAFDADAEPWKPEPGDQVVGRAVEWTEGTSQYGTKRILILEELDSGRRIGVRLDYAVLAQELEQRDPQIGDTVVIRRNEDRSGARGIYRHYKVAVIPSDVAKTEPELEFVSEPVAEAGGKYDEPF